MLKKTARILFFALMVFAALPAWSLGGADSLKGLDIVIGNWWADWDSATRKANSDAEEKLIAYRAKIRKTAASEFGRRTSPVGSKWRS
jgi:hypothetical protein